MKTRIISAAVGLVLFVAVLAVSVHIPLVLCIALTALCVLGTYEMLHNTKLLKHPAELISALLSAVVLTLSFCGVLPIGVMNLVPIYFLLQAVLLLVCHKKTDAAGFFAAICVPVMLSFAFSTVMNLFRAENAKLFYFLLLFVFSWGTDTGAYFAGTFLGKHKLCPEISPKKTVEGAVGGILSSVLLTVILCTVYHAALSVKIHWLFMIAAAVIFAVVGMIGDLYASQIKRYLGIKDYGTIMPGHGGVMDRFDSVLMISSFFYLYLTWIGVL